MLYEVITTSFGGIVAAMYAAGYTPDEIENIFAKVDQTRLYGRSLEENPSLIVITSYSIHYTKLYDYFLMLRFFEALILSVEEYMVNPYF